MTAPAYLPPPRTASTPSPDPRLCPRRSHGGHHQPFGGTICAHCGTEVTPTVTVTAEEVQRATEPVVEAAMAQAYVEGAEHAYARVISALAKHPDLQALVRALRDDDLD